MAASGAWRVATRRSALARAQAGTVADALAAATGRPAELVPLTTTGDDHPQRAGGAFDVKGLFVDGVRAAVLDGRADLVVHSYKDLPTETRRGLMIAAVPEREDPRDVLVTRDGAHVTTLRRGATVGTSSARRAAQIQRARRRRSIGDEDDAACPALALVLHGRAGGTVATDAREGER